MTPGPENPDAAIPNISTPDTSAPDTSTTQRPDPVHAFTDADGLGDLDAVGIAQAIRAGDLGRGEVVDAAIRRVQEVNPHLNAIQFACFDRARVAAGEGSRRPSPFSGVPSFVKDNTDVAGLPTCHGSAAFTPHPARRTTGPAEQFLAQGFTLLGKSTLPEFGLTASTEYVDRPPTRNPWNTEHSAGASSGGAAALVASGTVPIAHANDGGGSIRIPAAACGLVGLKPTRGRMLDRPGVRQLPVNLVSEGVVTRTVRDTAHYLAAAERFRPVPQLPTIGLLEGPTDHRLRVGVIRHDVFGRPVHPTSETVLNSAAAVLESLGHDVVERELHVDTRFVDDFKIYWALFAVLMTASFKAEHRSHFHPSKLDPFTKGLARLSARHALALPGAVRRLRGATDIYDAHFADVDVLLTPSLSHPAPLLGELAPTQPFEELFDKLVDYVGFTPLNNIGGGPAVVLPHTMLDGGLPGSIHLCGLRGDERTLLDVAYQFEAAAPFPRIDAAG